MATRDLSKMTVARLQVVQLREQLRSRGLPTDGTKAVLVDRLKGSYAAEDTILNSDASVSKDSLEEAVLEGAINEDDILGPDTSVKKKVPSVEFSSGKQHRTFLLSPSLLKAFDTVEVDLTVPKRLEGPVPAKAPVATSAAKESKPVQEPETGKKEGATAAADETLDAKLKRAQRFGLPLSNEQMKQKRAERFATQSTEAAGDAESLEEKKRKRAERFGVVNEAEKVQEVLDKRAKRFGIDNRAEKASTIGGVEKASLEVLERRAKRFGLCSEEAELEIKKQKRAERFGLNKNQ